MKDKMLSMLPDQNVRQIGLWTDTQMVMLGQFRQQWAPINSLVGIGSMQCEQGSCLKVFAEAMPGGALSCGAKNTRNGNVWQRMSRERNNALCFIFLALFEIWNFPQLASVPALPCSSGAEQFLTPWNFRNSDQLENQKHLAPVCSGRWWCGSVFKLKRDFCPRHPALAESEQKQMLRAEGGKKIVNQGGLCDQTATDGASCHWWLDQWEFQIAVQKLFLSCRLLSIQKLQLGIDNYRGAKFGQIAQWHH